MMNPVFPIGPALPVGFFENTQEVYAEIASYSVVPPEKIRQYWNGKVTLLTLLTCH